LEKWGLLPAIEAYSVRPAGVNLRSYRDGKILNSQPFLPLTEDKYGAPYLHIHRADFHRVLVEAAEREGVKIRLGSAVEDIDFSIPLVRVRGRPDFYADIVIGADGLKSVCREQLLGRKDPPHFTGDLAYRITVKASDMMKHPDLKEIAENPALNIWMGPYSHAVCYLLKAGDLYNIVLACPDNLPELVNTVRADLQEMRDFFANWDPKLRALLDMVQETSKWRLQNSHEMYTWSHPSGNFTLLGDACHATLPYVAQGAAMAVEDGAVLGALFEKVTRPSQLKDLLIIYEKIRKARTTRIVKTSSQMRDIYHCRDGDVQQERDRQLLEEEPFEEYPNPWADLAFQEFLFGYDAYAEAEKAWEKYLKGRFIGTAGNFSTIVDILKASRSWESLMSALVVN
jgi:salicylate hydroxylase